MCPGACGSEPAIALAKPIVSVIAGMPRMAAMVNKEMVNIAFETTLEQSLLIERRLFQILTATQDKAEGMAAFVEKRAAVWTGR